MEPPFTEPGFLNNSAGPRVRIMGILNLTPDSFSDGGKLADRRTLLKAAAGMIAAGADILDIGGESTRPLAPAVAVADELRRVLPAIEAIRELDPAIPISIDTTKAEVARRALAAGADIINDISALRFDPAMTELAAEGGWPVIIMHMQGTPRDMQLKPHYDDVVAEVKEFLGERIEQLTARGIKRERLIIDPGIGFGKTLEHNLAILRNLAQFRALGQPLLIGHSRKSFLAKLLGELPVEQRDLPSAVVAALCALNGADIIRTHNVEATSQALRLARIWQ